MVVTTLQKIVIAVLTAAISQVAIELVKWWFNHDRITGKQKPLRRKPFLPVTSRVISFLIIGGLCFGLVSFYTTTTLAKLGPSIRILSVDNMPLSEVAKANLGYPVQIDGDATAAKDSIYLVVKPVASSYWYIQPPTSEAGITTDGRTKWVGLAYLGTPHEGIGDSFSVYAIESTASYQGNTQLSAAPDGLKSNAVFLTRRR
jgi:hypothetical protein